MISLFNNPQYYILSYLAWILGSLLLLPLLPGVINRVKAFFAGRKGPPLIQLYFDLFRLFKKRTIWAECSTYVTRSAPIIQLICLFIVFFIIPATPHLEAPFAMHCDFIFAIGFLAMGRFVMLAASLDSGSSFQGMGASREMTLSILSEVAIIFAFMTLVVTAHEVSISFISFSLLSDYSVISASHFLLLIVFFTIMLFECCRIPFDDPNTHLELTMIHEVMVLDYSGPPLALLEYATAFKMWIFATLMSVTCLPFIESRTLSLLFAFVFPFIIAIIVGVIESSIARTRFRLLPRILFVCIALACLAFISSILINHSERLKDAQVEEIND